MGVVGVSAGEVVGVGVAGVGVSDPLVEDSEGELGARTTIGCGTALRRRTSGRGSSLDPRPLPDDDLNFRDAFFAKVLTPVSSFSGIVNDNTELQPSADVKMNCGLPGENAHINACRLDAFVESGVADRLLDADDALDTG